MTEQEYRPDEVMTVADAVKNCRVKAKKTIVRWAAADEIQEIYGKTTSATIERAVPVAWVRQKMKERGLEEPPEFEPVEIVTNVAFSAGGPGAQPPAAPVAGGPGAQPPALPMKLEAAPEFMELAERFSLVYEEHAELLEDFIKESRGLNRRMVDSVRDGQHTQHRSLHSLVKNTRLMYLLLGFIFLVVLVGGIFGFKAAMQLFRETETTRGRLEARVDRGFEEVSGKLKLRLDGLERNNQELSRQLEENLDQYRFLKGQLTEAQEDKDNLRADLEDVTAKREAALARIGELEAALDVRREEQEQLRTEQEALAAERDRLAADLAALRALHPSPTPTATPTATAEED